MLHRLVLVAVAIVTLCAGCANDPTSGKNRALTDTLRSYGATLRWNGIEGGEVFLDPKYREEHPLTSIDIGRYKQVRLADYSEQSPIPTSENEVQQTVEISLINRNTQIVRSLVDRQTWRYDEEAKRWWLMTGLPDITQRQ